MLKILLMLLPFYLHPPEAREMTDRLVPEGYQGNYWGPEAWRARHEGTMPPIEITPQMKRWDRWGRKVLKDGDIVFRMGDARVLRGFFPMSRFYANCSNSKFSHTGIVAVEEDGPVIYDTTGSGVARQPFCVWILDNIGNFGVKRLRPEDRPAVPKVLAYCRKTLIQQPPFDYELGLDDSALYCVEMTEKAFRYAGLAAFGAGAYRRHGTSYRVPPLHARDRNPLAPGARAPADGRDQGLFPRQCPPRHLVITPPRGGSCPHVQARLSLYAGSWVAALGRGLNELTECTAAVPHTLVACRIQFASTGVQRRRPRARKSSSLRRRMIPRSTE